MTMTMTTLTTTTTKLTCISLRRAACWLAALPTIALGCGQPPPPEVVNGDEASDSSDDVDDSSVPDMLDGESSGSEGSGESSETGEPGETDTVGETSETGEEPDTSLFPLVDGARWTYVVKTNANQVLGMDSVEASEMTWEGGQAWLFVEDPNVDGEWEETVIVRDGDLVMRVHSEENDQLGVQALIDYDPGFLRANNGWISVGDKQELVYTRTKTDGEGLNPKVDERGHTYEVLAVGESTQVPAGTFECVKVERIQTIGPDIGEVVVSWYAPGIGKVREHRPAESRVEELVSVSIPGGANLP